MANAVIPELQYKNDHGVARLTTHDVFLHGDHVMLRSMTEDDWSLLLDWNNDPEVMEYAEHDDFEPRTLAEVQSIYRWISTHAYCFIIEVKGQAIGECWLQRMNLRRIVQQFPDMDLWRIDLMIGFKELWGLEYGTEAIALLADFGFGRVGADAIFGIVSAENARSKRAFQKCGFKSHCEMREQEDGKMDLDLILFPPRAGLPLTPPGGGGI